MICLSWIWIYGFWYRGLVRRKQERYEEAIEDYSLELSYGPERNIKAFNNRAYCYAKLGMFEEAIEDYSQVIEIDSKNIHALHNRGISFERIGEYNAVRSTTKIIYFL